MGWLTDAVAGPERPAIFPDERTPAPAPEDVTPEELERRRCYLRPALDEIRDRCRAMRQAAVDDWERDRSAYKGENWDNACVALTRKAVEVDNTLGGDEAVELFRAEAPRDAGFDDAKIEDFIARARTYIGDRGRDIPPAPDAAVAQLERRATTQSTEPVKATKTADAVVDEDQAAGSSWQTVDLTDTVAGVIAGTITRPAPTVGRLEDGRALFYRGKVNGVAGASNAGKSWTGFFSAAQEIGDGHHVVYVDLEDDVAAAVTRLLDLGVDPQAIVARFHYVSPEESYTFASAVALNTLLDEVRPTLVVIDSTGESLALDGAKPNDDDDVARWFRRLPTPAARRSGAAVVILDHVVKAEDGGMWPIGSQRKRAAISGAQYMQVNVQPFDRTTPGHSKLVCAKDRHGNYRAGATVAMLKVTPNPSGVDIALTAPAETSASRIGTWRPTGIMEKISRALEAADGPLSFRKIDDQVSGKAAHKRTAIEELVKAGHLLITEGPRRSHLHTLVKPYDQRSDPASDLYDRAGHTQPPSDRVSVSVSLGGDTGHTHSNRVRTQSGHGGDTVSSEGLDGGLEPSPAPGAVGRSAATAPPSRTTPIAGGRWHYDHATGRLVDPATGEITEQVDGPTSSTQNTTERTAS